jgi:copper chaperone CopZ
VAAWKAGGIIVQEGGTMEKTIKVEGMGCKSCEKTLTGILVGIRNVKGISADSKTGIVTITATDGDAFETGKLAIVKKGYRVVD